MIAVLPKSDIVIVNRANTYEGERTPMPALLDLIEEVLEARTGKTEADPTLVPLEVDSDPMITRVPAERLEEFVGEWAFPPAPLGVPQVATLKITMGPGHLVSSFPTQGTFKLYLQEDGTFHQEDSNRRFAPVRDDSGAFAGLAPLEMVSREEPIAPK